MRRFLLPVLVLSLGCDATTATRAVACGNGLVEEGEECDPGRQPSAGCTEDCKHMACGDGVINGSEECDDGDANSDIAPDACRKRCRRSACGDGVIDTGETCDAGPGIPTDVADACRADCTPARCGDGVVDTGEDCDDGGDNADDVADACRLECILSRCGDGTVDGGEECDDGNTLGSDGCSHQCREEVCGNGHIDWGEQCDNGLLNSDNTPDACRTSCQWATCGDQVIDTGEVCDDGNQVTTDDCPDGPGGTCAPAECGDGFIYRDGGESCETPGAVPYGDCTDCVLTCSISIRVDCNQDPIDGCEAVYGTNHCGQCYRPCHDGQGCYSIQSVSTCSSQDLYMDEVGPRGLALDDTHVFWTTMDAGTVRSIDELGVETVRLLTDLQVNPWAIAVDDTDVYWSNLGTDPDCAATGSIMRQPKDGSATPEQIDTADCALAVAVNDTHVYWVDWGNLTAEDTGAIMRAAKSSGTPEVFAPNQCRPAAIVLDSDHAYWLTYSDPALPECDGLVKMPLAGGTIVELSANSFGGAALVANDTHVFWLESWGLGFGNVHRILKDGSEEASVLCRKTDLTTLAVDDRFIYVTTANILQGMGRVPIDNQHCGDCSATGCGSIEMVTFANRSRVASMVADGGYVYFTDPGAFSTGSVSRWNTDF